MKYSNYRILPYLALAFGTLGLGFSAIFVTWANSPGAVTGFYRLTIAAAVLALPFGRELKRSESLSRTHLWLAVLAGLFFAFDLTAWNTAVLITSAANSTLLANTSPFWVAIGALILFKEKLSPLFWLGLLLAMAGAAIILGNDYLKHPAFSVGDLLSLASGFFYGAFFLATQRAREKLSSLVSWWISAITSAVAMLLLSVLFNQPLSGYSATAYYNFAAMALVTQVGAYLSVNYALGHLPASIVAPTLLGQPVITAILAVPLLGQPLGMIQIIGGGAVIAGIWIVHRSR